MSPLILKHSSIYRFILGRLYAGTSSKATKPGRRTRSEHGYFFTIGKEIRCNLLSDQHREHVFHVMHEDVN